MPDSFQALVVLMVGLLPGALYTWAFEREAGAWGTRFADRALRFIGISAMVHALLAPVTFGVWDTWIRSNRLMTGKVPLLIWLVPVAYAFAPILLGSLVGRATRARRPWARIFTGPNPAPRAWDHLFAHSPDGWIRLRMKGGFWLAGAFATRADGSRSYAAGYPDEQDLYLVETVNVNPISGEFLDDDGEPSLRGSGILVRWEEVEYLEFIEV